MGKVSHITMDNVTYYIDFLKKSGIREFKILGGEPTLHPHFCDIVEAGLAEEDAMDIIVFTNGLWPEM